MNDIGPPSDRRHSIRGFSGDVVTAWSEADAERLGLGARIGVGVPHESAHLHVTGTAAYIDDVPERAGTLHAALGLSPVGAGRLIGIDTGFLRALPGVVAVLTAADIPAINDCGPIFHDDPILAEDDVRHCGQPVFVIVATERDLARRAAARAGEALTIEPAQGIYTARAAHARGDYVLPPVHLIRESTDGALDRALATAPHRLRGHFSLGGQEQFYLEGQITYAIPTEGHGLHVMCSTQHPSEMQQVIAHALGWRSHRVLVECRRMGGGFGGKESQSALFACAAALAARQTNRPVKLRLDRDDDFLVTGRRHPFEFDYDVGFDDAGRILGFDVSMIANAGHSADLSGPVVTRALCHVDNAYFLPEVAIHGYAARTNTQSNTAFRGFGGPQGALVTEIVLDRIARALGRDALEIRCRNLYGTATNNITPYGQIVEDNVIGPIIDDLVVSSGYHERRAAVAQFNRDNIVLKKGLALTPVKFGISFNVPHLNQAGALVHIYVDGSILVNHGGTEMGQGLNTKVAQVVADVLGVGFDAVRCTAADTSKVANTSATAASTGADLNGMAAADAAHRLRDRLATFAARHYECDPASIRFANGMVALGARAVAFATLVRQAYEARVQLWSEGFYTTPKIHWNPTTMNGRPFYYFAYGAAVSEVVIDTLTGEFALLRADILHDAGQSLNPAIDIGQIEGGFIQSLGWLTTEELVWHEASGRLLTHAPSTYKIPTANDCPAALHVRLFENINTEPTIFRSKAVGEPPMLLAFSALLAIRDAIAAVGNPTADPPLRAPATPEAILDAIEAVRANEAVRAIETDRPAGGG
ncbi:MAG: xanthine dehydrogenase molybdopterin binding subunit [Acidiphilium sp.]|nr:xanthine dehydrogenase molybdopterin binding subunit [Acidiphilium sp.]MDD4936287.1 xanthine dehydrogenase molybdopterin binding subunit [Acidiphilium sp.]